MLQRYHGDSAWTYAVGNVSNETKRLMNVCEGALFAGLEQVKPGVRLSDISHAIEEYLTKKSGVLLLVIILAMGLEQTFTKIPLFLITELLGEVLD